MWEERDQEGAGKDAGPTAECNKSEWRNSAELCLSPLSPLSRRHFLSPQGAMYNVMAASQHLAVTPRRALLATAAAAGVPWLLLGGQGALIVCATALVTALAAIYYAEAILGGVVGDYMGATVQITEILIYLALSARWGALAPGAAGAGDAWRHIGVLLAAVVVPVAWTRQIVDFAC